MDWINSLTGGNVLTFLLIGAAFLWIFNLIGTSVETLRKLRRKRVETGQNVDTRLDDHDKKLANGKVRLDNHEAQINDQREGMRQTCTGVKALLNHQLHDGNTHELEQAASDLDKWLLRR